MKSSHKGPQSSLENQKALSGGEGEGLQRAPQLPSTGEPVMLPSLSVPFCEKVTLFPTSGPDPQAREPPASVHPGRKSPRTEQADGGLEVDTEGW